MAYGVVPVAGHVSSIPQYIKRFGCGVALPPDDLDGFARALAAYAHEPAKWTRESANAVAATRWFTFEQYLSAIDTMLDDLGVRTERDSCNQHPTTN